MKVLITGGAGFIGSHLAETLIKAGNSVVVIDNLSTGRIENIQHLLSNKLFRFVRASIMEEVVLDRLACDAEVIVHLAAAVGVELIVKDPVYTIETNIRGTELVTRVALRYGCKTLIASTSEVYGKGIKTPFAEDDDVVLGSTTKARWSYAASKMVDEFLGLAYFNEYGLDVIIVRLFNTVGPRQTGQYGMVIPRFMKQALEGKDITVYGDGNQSRCFCDVKDVLAALVSLINHPQAPGKVFNIGSTHSIKIMDLAQKVKTIARSNSKIVLVPYAQAYAPGFEDMQSRVPDISRINRLVGWQPQISLDDCLLEIKKSMEV